MKLNEVNPFEEIPPDYSNEGQMRKMELTMRALNFQISHVVRTISGLKSKMDADYHFCATEPKNTFCITGSLWAKDTPENRKTSTVFLRAVHKLDGLKKRLARIDTSYKRLEKLQPGYVPDLPDKKRARFR